MSLQTYSTGEPGNVHKNAKLAPTGRALLVKRIEAGERAEVVAREMGVSRRTAFKWLKRYREEGEEGLEDRSSRPHHHSLILCATYRCTRAIPLRTASRNNYDA